MTTNIAKFGYDPIIRDIPDYPKYQICEDGTVYNKVTGREMKMAKSSNGYLLVRLRNKAGPRTHSGHRLVASVFIDNPQNKPLVDHINRVKTDNSTENLRWVTNYENQINVGERKPSKSGVVGVRMKPATYNRVTYNYWIGHINVQGKQHSKNFPGTDEGFKQACTWRKAMEEKYHVIE